MGACAVIMCVVVGLLAFAFGVIAVASLNSWDSRSGDTLRSQTPWVDDQ